MKKLQENINKALVESGFSVSEKINQEQYLALSDEEKDTYTRDWSVSNEEVYVKAIVDPDFADEDTDKVQLLLLYRKLNEISDNVKTIKSCTVFFTVLTIISLIASTILSIISANQLSKALSQLFDILNLSF